VVGVVVAAAAVSATTGLVYPLADVAPVTALGVVYLVAVLLVSSLWGGWLGAATALASALAFNFFHIPPTGRFTISEGENWVALAVFFVAALVASTLPERARLRTREARWSLTGGRAPARGGGTPPARRGHRRRVKGHL
jgi:two-component system sensor histidine kinase KdpD